MHIEVQFSLTPEDVHEYVRAYGKAAEGMKDPPRRSILRQPVLLITALVAAAVIAYFAYGQPWMHRPAPLAPPLPLHLAAPGPAVNPALETLLNALPFLLFGAIFLFFFLRMRFSKSGARKMLAETPEMAEPQHFTFVDDGVTMRGSTSTVTSNWNHFTHFHETENLFLLFISKHAAHLLPKRAFPSPADVETFRAFALAHVGNKPIGFPVQLSGAAIPPAENSANGPALDAAEGQKDNHGVHGEH